MEDEGPLIKIEARDFPAYVDIEPKPKTHKIELSSEKLRFIVDYKFKYAIVYSDADNVIITLNDGTEVPLIAPLTIAGDVKLHAKGDGNLFLILAR